MLVNTIFLPFCCEAEGQIFYTKKPIILIFYLMSFNQQIMNLFFYFFLRLNLYQLQGFFIDHILDSVLDTHIKRRTFRTRVINILISNNIQHLEEMIHLILDTFKLKQVSSHQLHHMSKFHIISSSD